MPLVNAKCTNCGANLEVDNAQDAAICKFCGSAFIVEKAINNYNVTNNIKADVVNIYGSQNSDFVVRAGVLEKYNGESTSVVIPENVTHIGEKAFKGCLGLLEITISKNVQNINPHSFNTCTSLRAINVCNDNCFYSSSDGVLLNKNKTTLLCCPIGKTGDYIMPDSVTELSSRDTDSSIYYHWTSFGNCNLSSVTISKNVKKIGRYVFSESKIKKMIIPENVIEIDTNAFWHSSIKEIVLPKNIKIELYSFSYCQNLTCVTLLSNNIDNISHGAFHYDIDGGACPIEEVRCLPKLAKELKKRDGGPFRYSKWAKRGCHPHCVKCGTKLNLFGKCPNCD